MLLPKLLTILTTRLSVTFPGVTELAIAMEQGVFGAIIILFLIFEPDGLAHRWKTIRAYWKLYPFSY
jgi:branched-chain amino acid transport system permease protein